MMKRGPYGAWLSGNSSKPRQTAHNDRKRKYSEENASETRDVSGQQPSSLQLNVDESECADEDWKRLSNPNCKDTLIYENAKITISESVILLMNHILENNLSGAVAKELLSIITLHLPKNSSPEHLESLYQLKKYFGLMDNNNNFTLHDVCSICLRLFSKEEQHCPMDGCDQNSRLNDKGKTKQFFIEFNIESQLKDFFKDDEFKAALGHRFKVGMTGESYKDIYDGALYQNLVRSGFANNPYNISLLFHTDGASCFKSNSKEIWPFQCFINELPPNLRFSRKYTLVPGMWFGTQKPNMISFMKPIASTLNNLYKHGVAVQSLSTNPKIGVKAENFPPLCRVCVMVGTMDLLGMCLVKELTQFNGRHGCGLCLELGETVERGKGHSRVYPCPESVSTIKLRTAKQTKRDAKLAIEKDMPVNGVKGVTALSLLKSFPNEDFTVTIDYMHGALLGIGKNLINYWVNGKFKDEEHYIGNQIEELDARTKLVNLTSEFTRTPRSIQEYKDWKASEFKSFILYWGAFVLKDILPGEFYDHFILLASGLYLLLTEDISKEDLRISNSLLIKFAFLMPAYYGEGSQTMNVHNLLHYKLCVEQTGPLWASSCFAGESHCGFFISLIHSPNKYALQIVSAVKSLNKLQHVEALVSSPEVKEYLHGKQQRSKIHEELTDQLYRTGPIYRIEDQMTKDLLEDWKRGSSKTANQFYKVKFRKHNYTSDANDKETRSSNFYIQLQSGEIAKIQRFISVSQNTHVMVVKELLKCGSLSNSSFDALVDSRASRRVTSIYGKVMKGASCRIVKINQIKRKVCVQRYEEETFVAVPVPLSYEHN